MLQIRRLFVLLVVSLSCALFATGCDDVISDPNFHTWCGDQLCSWKLESGEIRKAATWHPKDFGVELLDGSGPSHVTAISQRVDKSPTCLEFSVIADVAAEAQVTVGVDFGADGTIEYEQPIAALGFREQKTQITAPLNYVGLKFIITKKGSGRAVLAQMDVRSKTDCTAAPLQLKPQAIGTRCSPYADRRTTCLSARPCAVHRRTRFLTRLARCSSRRAELVSRGDTYPAALAGLPGGEKRRRTTRVCGVGCQVVASATKASASFFIVASARVFAAPSGSPSAIGSRTSK